MNVCIHKTLQPNHTLSRRKLHLVRLVALGLGSRLFCFSRICIFVRTLQYLHPLNTRVVSNCHFLRQCFCLSGSWMLFASSVLQALSGFSFHFYIVPNSPAGAYPFASFRKVDRPSDNHSHPLPFNPTKPNRL